MGLSGNWVCGLTALPSLCLPSDWTVPALVLLADKAGQSLHLGFPYLEKRTWLNCQILRPERQQPHHVQVSVCLPHSQTLSSFRTAPQNLLKLQSTLPAQQRKQFSTGLWAMLTLQNWAGGKPEYVIGYLSIQVPRHRRCLKDFPWRITGININ